MKPLQSIIILCSVIFSWNIINAQYYQRLPSKQQEDFEGSHMLGLSGGIALTSYPSSLQPFVGKASSSDFNGGFTYLYHKQSNKWFAWEIQLSIIFSSVNTLPKGSVDGRLKTIFPLDFRSFFGHPVFSAYIGAGLQMYSIRDYFTQIASNLAAGFKFGFGNTDTSLKRHGAIIGAKVHLPFVDHYIVTNDNIVETALTCEKTNVSLTAALSFDIGRGWSFKLDYELPFSGNNIYKINDGGHSTFLNSRSQSLTLTFLKRL